MPGSGNNPEFIRGFGLGWQNVAGTPAATLAYPPYLTKADITDDIKYDIPKFLNYRLWRETVANPATRAGKFSGEGYLDPYWFGWWLISMAGVPTGSNPFVFLGGSLGAGLLTLIKVNPALTTYRRLHDAVVTKLEVSIDAAAGRLPYTIEAVGIMEEPISSPPVPSYGATPPTLAPYEAVYSTASTAYGIISGKFTWEKTATPHYESPVVAPSSGAPVGLAPTEFEIETAGGGFDFLGRYLADAGSLLYKLRHGTAYAQSLSIFDPNTTGTPGVLLEMPNAQGTSGEEQDAQARSRQHIVGRWLYDTTLASGIRATLTPAAGQTYASS